MSVCEGKSLVPLKRQKIELTERSETISALEDKQAKLTKANHCYELETAKLRTELEVKSMLFDKVSTESEPRKT